MKNFKTLFPLILLAIVVSDVAAGSMKYAKARLSLGGSQEEAEKNPDSFEAHRDLARALTGLGKHREALEHYMWCWDSRSDNDPDSNFKQDFRLMSDIEELGLEYPAAFCALYVRIERLEERVLNQTATVQDVEDLGTLALKLDQKERAHAAFGSAQAPLQSTEVTDAQKRIRRWLPLLR